MANKGKGKSGGNKGPAANPGAKGQGSGAEKIPPSSEDKFRGLSGGGTRGRATAPSGTSGAEVDKNKDTLVTWTEGAVPWWVASVLETIEPDWLGYEPVADERCEEWRKWAALLGQDKPKIVLVFKHLMSSDDSDAEVDIFRALLKVLTSGRAPKVTQDAAYEGQLDIWNRKHDEEMLGDAEGIHHRYQGADSQLMASPLAIWPPPLELVTPGDEEAACASASWEVRFNRTPLHDELKQWAVESMTTNVWKGTTFFRKADAKGRPTETFVLKALAVKETAKVNFEFTTGPQDNVLRGTAIWAPQCALCLERSGRSGAHDHTQCPLVGTLNKIRQQGELRPLEFTKGTLVRSDVKVDLDVPKEVRAMKDLVAALVARVDRLEKAQAGPATAPNPGQGKKRKPEGGGQQGAPPAKKGKGGGNGGQSGQGKPPSRGPQGGNSGKGPAGGSVGATSWGS